MSGLQFDAAVADIRDRLGANAVPIQMPVGVEDALKVLSIWSRKTDSLQRRREDVPELVEIAAALHDDVAKARDQMIAALADL